MIDSTEEKLSYLKKSPFFKGLDQQQLLGVAQIVQELEVRPNVVFVKENDKSDHIFIIKKGSVEIFKSDKDETNHSIIHLHQGELVGEISLLDELPRAASVRAVEPTTLYMLSIEDLKNQTEVQINLNFIRRILNYLNPFKKPKPSIYSIVLHNAAKKLTERIRHSNNNLINQLKNQLEVTKAQVQFGKFTINVFVFLALFIFIFGIIQELKTTVVTTSYISVPLILMFAIPLFIMMKRSGYPLSMYGFTTKNWKKSVYEAIIFSIPLMIAICLLKLSAIYFLPQYGHNHLFDLGVTLVNVASRADLTLMDIILFIFLYSSFVPLQEFVARGALQSSLQELMTGPHATLLAILVSNLLFSSIHVYISIYFALLVYFPGLLWGWLYARERTLIGPITSHILVGTFSLGIVGIMPL